MRLLWEEIKEKAEMVMVGCIIIPIMFFVYCKDDIKEWYRDRKFKKKNKWEILVDEKTKDAG